MKMNAVPKQVMAIAKAEAPSIEYPFRSCLLVQAALNWGSVESKDKKVPIFIRTSIIPFPPLRCLTEYADFCKLSIHQLVIQPKLLHDGL